MVHTDSEGHAAAGKVLRSFALESLEGEDEEWDSSSSVEDTCLPEAAAVPAPAPSGETPLKKLKKKAERSARGKAAMRHIQKRRHWRLLPTPSELYNHALHSWSSLSLHVGGCQASRHTVLVMSKGNGEVPCSFIQALL